MNNNNKLINTTNKNIVNNGHNYENFITDKVIKNKKLNSENIYNFLS